MKPNSKIFPSSFLWGAAFSSHQNEGGNKNQWTKWESSSKRRSEIEKKVTFPEIGYDNYISNESSNHYDKYKEDLDIAKSLGFNSVRISIEWSRIEPSPMVYDEKEVQHYIDVLGYMNKIGIKPIVTLWHWTFPIWFDDLGGFEKKKNFLIFERYTSFIVQRLKGLADYWIIFNEVNTYLTFSYVSDIFPPQKKNPILAISMYLNFIKSHNNCYKRIKEIDPNLVVGIAHNFIYPIPEKESFVAFFNIWLVGIVDMLYNQHFVKHTEVDFIGVQLYLTVSIDGFSFSIDKDMDKVSDVGWGLNPSAMYHVLCSLKKYNKKIIITEHGLADSQDKYRSWYILETLKYVRKAIDEGVDCQGYLHWTLIDNFEWESGFFPRFGLVEVDCLSFDKVRIVRRSAYDYSDFIRSNKD